MKKIEGQFNNILEVPFAYFVYKDRTPNEYLILQIDENIGLGILWNNEVTVRPKIDEFLALDIMILSVSELVIIISISTGSLIMKMPLHEAIEKVINTPFGLLLLTETTLLKIDNETFAVSLFIVLPDVIDKYIIINNQINITGITGEIFKIIF